MGQAEEEIRAERKHGAKQVLGVMEYTASWKAYESLSEEGREIWALMVEGTDSFGASILDVYQDANGIDRLSHDDRTTLDRFVARQTLIDAYRREIEEDEEFFDEDFLIAEAWRGEFWDEV